MDITNKELITFLKTSEVLNTKFAKDLKYGFDLDLDSFMLRIYNLNPSMYGYRFQAYLSLKMEYTAVPSTDDQGDFLNREGESVELKCSFQTCTNKIINVKNIRIWQPTKYYYIFAVDYADFENLKYDCFKLNKQEMIEEMLLCGARPQSNTKAINSEHENRNESFSIKIGSNTHTRWLEKYKLNNFDLRKICDEKVKEANYKENLLNTIKELETRLILISEEESTELNNEILQLDLFSEDKFVEKIEIIKEVPKVTEIIDQSFTNNKVIQEIKIQNKPFSLSRALKVTEDLPTFNIPAKKKMFDPSRRVA